MDWINGDRRRMRRPITASHTQLASCSCTARSSRSTTRIPTSAIGLIDLVSRIKCVPCDEADNPDLANLCKLEVVLESGSSKTVRVEFHRGHFKNPMTDAEMARKHLAANRVDDLLRLSWGIENSR
jgi:2-methylcitrate dehydratase PrpD